jgi:hypothetical protein
MLFASVLLATSLVNAQTNIVLGNNLSGFANSVQFTGNGAGANVAFLGSCGANACTEGGGALQMGLNFANAGTFEMDYLTAQPLVITNTLTGNGFAMSGAVTFTFSLANTAPLGPGTLTGTINFTSFADGSSTPSFRGSITTTSVTGSLQPLFGIGTVNGVVFTINTGGPSVDAIFASNSAQVLTSPYSGNVPASAPPPVPEPATIAMLGSGLLVLGGTLKRRFFK